MSRVAITVSPAGLAVILGLMVALGPFTMDLYLPAFPAVASELAVGPSAVQATLSATAIGLGLGGLLVGPLSDRIGRRTPLIVATSLHVLASFGIALAPSIELIGVLRFVQGAGAAAGSVLASAMVRDLYGGVKLVKFLARIALVSGLAPIVAPVIGSQLLRVMDWRGIFVCLGCYGLIVATSVVLAVPETRRRALVRHSLSRDLVLLSRDRVFVGAVIVGGMCFSAIVAFLAISPFIFQVRFGLDPQQFGLYYGVQALGLLVATQLSARLLRTTSPARLLAISLPLMALSGIGFVIVDRLDGTLPWAMALSSLLVAASGFCNPCLQVLVLHGHPEQAGSAAALAGFANSAVGGVFTALPGWLGHPDMLGLGVLVGSVGIVAIVALWAIVRPTQPFTLEPDDLTGPIVVP